MSSMKLYQLLSSFSTEEMRSFRVFLDSSFFNQSKILLALFDYIRKYLPEYDSPKLAKEIVYKALKRSAPFTEKFITDRFSDLTKLVEEYLVVQYVRNNKALSGKALRESLVQHNQYDLFSKKNKKEIRALERKPRNDWTYFHDLWELHYEFFKHPQTNKWDAKNDNSYEMIKALDEAYLILKLRYGFHLRIRETIFKPKESDVLLEEIIEQSQKHKNPVVQLYILFLKNFEVEDVENHWQLIHDFYFKEYKVLPEEERRTGLLGLINRGFKIVLMGRPYFYKSILDLYQFGLEKKILIENGKITELTFKNIALIGSSTGEISWTTSFIKKYERFLPEDYDKNIIYLAHAYLAFYSKQFEKSKQWLDKSERMSTRDKNNFRSLFVRCLFEQYCTDETFEEPLHSYLESYTKFLHRQKKELSDQTVKAYQNFLHLIKMMKEAKYLPMKERKNKLRKIEKEMEKRKSNIAASWLLEKLEEMEFAT